MSGGERRVFIFAHRQRRVEMGPHESMRAAQEAFQFRFGYWPGNAVGTYVWETR